MSEDQYCESCWAETPDQPAEVHDEVSSPIHYLRGGIEAIDVIEAWGLGYHLGNAIKYICRAGHKPGVDGITDLKKAHWYLTRVIEEWEDD